MTLNSEAPSLPCYCSMKKPTLARNSQVNSWRQRQRFQRALHQRGLPTDTHLEAISGKHLSAGAGVCKLGQPGKTPNLVDDILMWWALLCYSRQYLQITMCLFSKQWLSVPKTKQEVSNLSGAEVFMYPNWLVYSLLPVTPPLNILWRNHRLTDTKRPVLMLCIFSGRPTYTCSFTA